MHYYHGTLEGRYLILFERIHNQVLYATFKMLKTINAKECIIYWWQNINNIGASSVRQFQPRKQLFFFKYHFLKTFRTHFHPLPRNNYVYFVANPHEVYAWNIEWQTVRWHHNRCYTCYQWFCLRNNQVTWPHGTLASTENLYEGARAVWGPFF